MPACAAQPAGSGGFAVRSSTSRSTSAGSGSGSSAFSTNRRRATAGSSVAASAISCIVCAGIGCMFVIPDIVATRTSFSNRSA